MKNSIKGAGLFVFIIAAGCFLAGATWAGESFSVDNQGLAIKGYDVVDYFKSNEAVQGNKDYQYAWGGAVWYFSTAENRLIFTQAPEKYVPQYGGYCAFVMSKGAKKEADPTAWSIIDEKLYLAANAGVLAAWKKDRGQCIREANINWSRTE